MLISLHLHGLPGNLFGRKWTLDVASPAEALGVIIRRRPKLADYLVAAEENGTLFRFIADGKPLSCFEEVSSSGAKEVHLYPIVKGSKRQGALQVIIGVILVVVAVVVIAYSGGSGATFMSKLATGLTGKSVGGAVASGWLTAGAMAFMMGVSMTLGGIAQMLTKTPRVDIGSAADTNRSYLFNGSSLASRQGVAIPIGYGAMHVGGIILSAGMSSDKTAYEYVPPSITEPDSDGDGIPDNEEEQN